MSERTHLTWERIVGLLVDHRDTGGAAGRHLEHCAPCRARVERAKQALESLPGASARGAPDTWIARAERRAVPRGFLAPLRGAHLAHVVFDSSRDRRAGIRAGTEGGRQWLLAGERIEIELHLSDPLEDVPFQLSGQLFAIEGEAPGLEGCRVRLEVEGEAAFETTTGPGGTFYFASRPGAAFRIRVVGDGWEITSLPLPH